MKERDDSVRTARAGREPAARAAVGPGPALLGLQQATGNRAFARMVGPAPRLKRGRGLTQRGALQARLLTRQPAPPPRDAKHPESFATYEEWLASLGALANVADFKSNDKAPKGKAAHFTVLGEKDKPASRDPKAPADERPPPPIGPTQADKFIDHPTDAWVKANLPPELRETAYRLPADCADIAVILRHVWLFSHLRSERYGGFVVGFVPGETAGARSNRVLGDIRGIDTPQLPMMVDAYTDSSGKPVRSFVALAPLLHLGDILVWAHHAGPEGKPPDPTRPRSGGHSQTIASIERDDTGKITRITCLQGNQPLPKESGEELRHAPGRRIEIRTFDEAFDLTDLVIPATKTRSAERVWDFGDGHTTLVVAGPPRSGGDRPAPTKEGGKTVRRLVDWLSPIAKATRSELEGRFEAPMREAQTMLERGDAVMEVEGEARRVANAARLRLAALDAQLAKGKKPPDPAVADGIAAMLKVKQTGTGSTAPAKMKRVFTAVADAFAGTAGQAGWTDAALTGINFGERMVGHVRRIPLDGLPTGASRAIVVLPASVTGGPGPVDVLLHFHGHNTGYQSGRDITIDKVEAQLEASGRRMIAVLPQGTAKANFGAFATDAYLKAVFAKLTTLGLWTPAPPRGSVVLAGHSGGGREVSDLLSTGSMGPLQEVALFDGVNGPDELAAVETWVTARLDEALARLKPVKGKQASEDAILRSLVRFRAYHSGSPRAAPSRRKLDYAGLHATLRATIERWLADHTADLSPNAATGLREHFQVIATGQTDHDRMLSGQSKPGSKTGALEDALTVSKP